MSAAGVAEAVETAPQVVFTNDGQIQLEWHRCGVDIEILIEDSGDISGWWEIARAAADPRETKD